MPIKTAFSQALRECLIKVKKEKTLSYAKLYMLTNVKASIMSKFLNDKDYILSYDNGKFIEEFLSVNKYIK